MKVIIASDSFKGCLSSTEASDAIGHGVHDVIAGATTECIPLADGGEGTVDAFSAIFPGRFVDAAVRGPLGDEVEAPYYIADNGVAVLETASVAGLTQVPPNLRNPLKTTTYGLGQLISDALRYGVRRIFVGLGGSATNDAGMGMLAALGVRFFDSSGVLIKDYGGGSLEYVSRVDATALDSLPDDLEVVALADVETLFHDAPSIFGPQKGADAAMVRRLEYGMENFARVVRNPLLVNTPGGGAAGGLGAALVAFLHARIVPGAEAILENYNFAGASLVITGEGHIDSQTLLGKAPARVLAKARACGVPCMALAGKVDDESALRVAGFTAVRCINSPGASLDEAQKPEVAAERLRRAAALLCDSFKMGQQELY